MSREAIEEAIEVLEDASAEMLMETGDENYYAEAIAILRQALSGEAVKHIKTWNERCEEHPDHQMGVVSERMIQARMQEEIDELRQALETDLARVGEVGVWGERKWQGLTDEEIQDLSYLSQKIDASNSPWFDCLGFYRAVEQALKEKNHG